MKRVPRGGLSWDRKVVQLICEVLVIGISPKAIQESMATLYEILNDGKTTDDLPSIDFIRRQRTVVQVIGETVSAIRLGRAAKWDQGFVDATSRGQSEFQCYLVGLLGEDFKMETITVSSCIMLTDATSERTSDSVFEQVR